MKTLDQRILELLKKYMEKLKHKKVLTSREEVEANTNETNLVAAPVVAELYNKLAGQPEFVYGADGKITGYKTPGGADTVFPFNTVKGLSFSASMGKYGGGQSHILLPTFDCESIKYRINDAGTFTIGLTTEFPASFESFSYTSVMNIRNQALYGYRQVLSQHLNTAHTGIIDTKGYKGIYMTQEEQGSIGAITLTYQ